MKQVQQLQTSEDKVKLKHNFAALGSAHSHVLPFDLQLGTASIMMLCCHGNTLLSLSYVQCIYACVYLQAVSVHLIKHM